ncbi:RNA polymerase sigma factor [Actinomarinicola tropica]|uniref:Sigma-70 family RNA polymerase sigma factor n=1 Tax=Actinomarinicola tropica TaxID=2789776 RepID=A0A5Q2RQH5_9ACTN|nr:sigma-70 family RNA polymerase sigma factor [Actinomarinicola tropica]QGG96811.1 sigma-70 family RNA polymerase sigma factor [Actinomarinicola tropica]
MSDPLDDIGQMVDEHGPAVYRYLARRVGGQAAEDLTADVLCAAVAGAHTYDPARGSPIAWLMGIATNALTRHWRTEQRQLEVVSRLGADPLRRPTVDAPDRHAAGSDDLRAVARVLATLPDGEREALLLFAWADLPYGDVAAALGIPIGTVRSRIARARSRLRVELDVPDRPSDDTDAVHDTGGSND